MADIELGELYGSVTRSRGAIAGWIGWVGALTSLAMVVGVGVWGYKLMMRDVNGIPVIRALEGPMRIQPKDPGGDRVAHQGLAVNEVAAGAPPQVSDELVLAPAAPELLDHDLARADLMTAPPPDYNAATDRVLAGILQDAAGGAMADDPDPAAADVAAPVVLTAADLVPSSVPGVKRSPRPPARPESVLALAAVFASAVPVSAVDPVAAAASDMAVEIDADTLPPGSRLVQLGAFESVELAREAWGRTRVKFDDVMAGKQRVIQEATGGGETFYRLRVAGFRDLADAKRFCATLDADKSHPLCVPVALR